MTLKAGDGLRVTVVVGIVRTMTMAPIQPFILDTRSHEPPQFIFKAPVLSLDIRDFILQRLVYRLT